jgi:hypothetical protein
MAGLNYQEKQTLINGINNIDGFNECGIAFIGRNMSEVIRKSELPEGFGFWIVIVEIESNENNAINIQKTKASVDIIQKDINPSKTKNNTNIGLEILKMGVSCGTALLAGSVALGSAAAAPLTFGTSSIITVLSASAALAGAANCGLSSGRVLNELFDPGVNERYLDSDAMYTYTTSILDKVETVGAFVSLGQTAKFVINMQKSTGKSIIEISKGLDRAHRKRLAEDVAKATGKAMNRKEFLKLAKEGKLPKIFTKIEINQKLINELKSVIGSSLTLLQGAIKKYIEIYIAEEKV